MATFHSAWSYNGQYVGMVTIGWHGNCVDIQQGQTACQRNTPISIIHVPIIHSRPLLSKVRCASFVIHDELAAPTNIVIDIIVQVFLCTCLVVEWSRGITTVRSGWEVVLLLELLFTVTGM